MGSQRENTFYRAIHRAGEENKVLLLSAGDIQQVYSIRDAIQDDKKAFQMTAEKKVEVPQRLSLFSEKYHGDMLFMPAYAPDMDAAALKVYTLFPGNLKKGLPTSEAQVFLIDGTTGQILALLDGSCVTAVRTGAASGAAFDVLAKRSCRVGGLIGAGRQAASQLEAMMAVRKLEEVRVCSASFSETEAFVRKMSAKAEEYGVKLRAMDNADGVVEDADLLITVTPSKQPVFDAEKIRKGATVSCVGSYRPDMQEMDPRLLNRASKIYFDSREAVLAESGDFIRPLKAGTIHESDFTGNLGDVIGGRLPGRTDDEEIIVFETVGTGAQDLTAATGIYRRAVEAGIGTNWQ
jgi:ornithine cyclodeaminase/alanine dehydrogenase-like protein (mu-crystallin family)